MLKMKMKRKLHRKLCKETRTGDLWGQTPQRPWTPTWLRQRWPWWVDMRCLKRRPMEIVVIVKMKEEVVPSFISCTLAWPWISSVLPLTHTTNKWVWKSSEDISLCHRWIYEVWDIVLCFRLGKTILSPSFSFSFFKSMIMKY